MKSNLFMHEMKAGLYFLHILEQMYDETPNVLTKTGRFSGGTELHPLAPICNEKRFAEKRCKPGRTFRSRVISRAHDRRCYARGVSSSRSFFAVQSREQSVHLAYECLVRYR